MMGPTEPLASGVIAYNGDSERGWNDPPTLSFSGVTASKKGPKLDLRKRVSHQEALTGQRVTSPLTQNQTNLYKQVNDLSNGLSNLAVGQKSSFQDANVSPSPGHSRHSSGTYTPPLLPDAKSYGMVPPVNPTQTYPTEQSNLAGLPSFGGVQAPVTTSSVNSAINVGPPKIFSPVETTLQSDSGIIHPLPQKTNTTSQVTAPPPSNLGNPLFSFPNSFHMVPVSSALDTSHVCSNPNTSPDTSFNTTQESNVPSTNKIPSGPLIFTPSPTGGSTPPAISNIGKRSPVLTRTYQTGNGIKVYAPPSTAGGSGRNSPIVSPALVATGSPVSTPPGGHSTSTTPRSTTPDSGHHSQDTSRHNSEEFDCEEGMKVTVEAIEEIIIKCSNILKTREVEDVKRKVEIMKQLWVDGKLSVPVQMTMKSLTKALAEGDTDTAHKLHLKLMVDYVKEVKQWMVAIKRLISAVGSINTPVSE